MVMIFGSGLKYFFFLAFLFNAGFALKLHDNCAKLIPKACFFVIHCLKYALEIVYQNSLLAGVLLIHGNFRI